MEFEKHGDLRCKCSCNGRKTGLTLISGIPKLRKREIFHFYLKTRVYFVIFFLTMSCIKTFSISYRDGSSVKMIFIAKI